MLLLSVSACASLRSARDDVVRLTSSTYPAQNPAQTRSSTALKHPSPAPARREADKADKTDKADKAEKADKTDTNTTGPSTPQAAAAESINLVGRSERDIRSLLGPPTSEEENTPGKTWRYRDGRCSLDVQLYPDVKTRQYGTLAYEVKSDDNTTEGKRLCLGQFQSRNQAKRE